MNFFNHSLGFWVAVAAAIIVKLVTSENHRLSRVLAMVICALFAAVIFTDPVLRYLNLSPEDYKVAVAALLALTGEGAMRIIIHITSSPEKLIDFVKGIWGKK